MAHPCARLRLAWLQVVTLTPELMKTINPARMDVPFSIVLDEDALLDESALASAVWEASVKIREHCSFRSW